VAFDTIEDLEHALRGVDYLPDRGLATALYLSFTAREAAALGR
jgi:hypothetical protein